MFILIIGGFKIPETKLENVFFTLITSGLMIFLMGVYNVAIHTGGLRYLPFLYAAHSFPFEWLIGFLLAFFIVGKAAKQLAFKVAQPQDRAIFIILCIQTFTVCVMVPMMSIVGVIEQNGLTADLPVLWLQTAVINFVMALPLQIFAVGPVCRRIFRALFR